MEGPLKNGMEQMRLGEQRNTIESKEFYENRKTDSIFREISKQQDERIRKESPFGNLKTWKLLRVIVKSNDDVR